MPNSRGFNGGLKGYWRRRTSHYSRLRHTPPPMVLLGSAPDSDSTATAAAGCSSSTSRRGRFWRIPRRIRFLTRIGSPRRWITRLRDAYVRAMLHVAGGGCPGLGYGAFAMRELKEYDEKMLLQIYKQLLSSQGTAVVVKAVEASVSGCPTAI